MDFKSDLHDPLPPKVEAQPQAPQPAPAAIKAAEAKANAPERSTVLPSGTIRQEADHMKGPFVNEYGQLVSTRPKLGPPEKAVPKPVRYDPHARYPDSGESRCAFRVTGNVVQNMSSGEILDSKMEPQYGGFSTLCAGMVSRRLS